MTYLITWCCYGTHVPGEDGIVSRRNHMVGARREPSSPSLARAARTTMNDAVTLGAEERQTVLQALVEVCRFRNWALLAAHVRTTHVHVVVDGDRKPELVLNAFKAYASRALNWQQAWARHGSTLYLWGPDEITDAVRYVVSKQGEPMAVFAA